MSEPSWIHLIDIKGMTNRELHEVATTCAMNANHLWPGDDPDVQLFELAVAELQARRPRGAAREFSICRCAWCVSPFD